MKPSFGLSFKLDHCLKSVAQVRSAMLRAARLQLKGFPGVAALDAVSSSQHVLIDSSLLVLVPMCWDIRNRCNDFDLCTKESHAGKFAVLCARNFACLASKVSLYFHISIASNLINSSMQSSSKIVFGERSSIFADLIMTTQSPHRHRTLFLPSAPVPVIDGIQALRDARDTVLGPTWIQKQSHETNLLPVIEHSNRTFQHSHTIILFAIHSTGIKIDP